MERDDERGHRTWWWMLLGAAGLALIMTAILLWPSTVANPGAQVAQAQEPTATDTPEPTATNTATNTPTATPTENPECNLRVTKSGDPDPVAPDGEITYTITIKNDADDNGSCDGFEVTDTIPTDTDCVSIDVTDDNGLDVDFDDDDCDASGTVTWDSTDDLDDGDEVVLEMVVELTSGADDGDEIENEACATSDDDEVGDCDTERTDVEEGAATATPGPTATTGATPYVPPPVAPPVAPPAPVVAPAADLVAPATGSGAESGAGGSQPLALALGLAGLLLLSGSVMLRRPR